MGQEKIRIEVSGVVSDNHLIDFLRGVQTASGRTISVYGGGDIVHLCRIGKGKIKGRWYEGEIDVFPEREQHLGVYTECERPYRVVLKSTRRNAEKLLRIADSFPHPAGGYLGPRTII